MKTRFPAVGASRWISLAFLVITMLGRPSALLAKSTWLKLEANDFVVYSDASRDDLVEISVQYAAYRQAFRSLFLAPDRVSPSSTLILFRRQRDFENHIRVTHEENMTTTNFTVEVDGTPLMAFPVAGDPDHALALTFEFETVWALRRAGYYIPIWMSQGAGEVLATLEVRKGRCIIGTSDEGHDSQYSNDENIEWPHFFEIGESSPEYTGRNATGAFHSQAWALMHWIMFADANTRERFADLAIRLRTTSGLKAVEEVMKTPAKDLHHAIGRHLMHERQRELPFDRAAVSASFKISPASEAEVLAQTYSLLAASDRILEANAELARARSLAPNHPAVLEALARQAARDGRPEDAGNYYHAAIAAGSKLVSTYLRSADARINESSVGRSDIAGGAGTNAAQAIEDLHRALALNPKELDIYRLLGRAYFVSPALKPEQIGELDPGVVPGEAGASVRRYRALLYSRVGNIDACLADFRAIVADPDISDETRTLAHNSLSQQILAAAMKKIQALADANQYDEAHKVVDGIDASDLNDHGKHDLDQIRLWLAESESWDRIDTLYSNADWAQLQAEAKKYLATVPRGAHRRRVEQLLKEASSHTAPAAPAAETSATQP